MLVSTTKGNLEMNTLKVFDVVFLEENARVVATEYYLPDAEGKLELVRRSVWADMLVGVAMAGEQQEM